MSNLYLFDKVVVSEREDGCLELLIRICGNGVNKNGKALDFSSEESIKTLINQPLQAKIKKDANGNEDFTGHNRKKVYVRDANGNVNVETVLDTISIGTFVDAYIENEDDKPYIYGKCLMWGNRYKKAKEIILDRVENGELKGSWEVIPLESKRAIIEGKVCDLFTEYTFIGFCLLGSKIAPAYDEAQILEVAEEELDEELSSAIAQDIDKIEEGGDEEMADINEIVEEVVETVEETVEETVVETVEGQVEEPVVETTETEEQVETSALSMGDLRRKVCQMAYELEGEEDYWLCNSIIYPTENTAYFSKEGINSLEEDYLKIVYSIDEEDNITIVSKEDVKMTFVPKETVVEVSELEAVKVELSEKINSIVDLGKTIAEKDVVISQKDELIAELEVFKTKVMEIEKEEAEKQFAAKKKACRKAALSSGYITEEDIEASEELKEAIEQADENKVMIFIASAVLKANAENIEVSESVNEDEEVEVSTTLGNDYDYGEIENPILNYIKTKKNKRR